MLLLSFLPFFVLCVIHGVTADLIWLPKRAPATVSSAQYGSLGQQDIASSWGSLDSAPTTSSSWGTLGVPSERRLVFPDGSPYTPEQQEQLANEGIKILRRRVREHSIHQRIQLQELRRLVYPGGSPFSQDQPRDLASEGIRILRRVAYTEL